MKVERATAADIDGLVAMRLEYLEADFGVLVDGDRAAIRKALPGYFREHLGRDLFGYIVREGDALAACALLLAVEKPMSPAFLNGRTGAVLNVYTRPAFRRRGYARAIMRALLADAEGMGLCVVELKATEDGYALYKSVGFVDDGEKYHKMRWTKESGE